MRLRTSRGGLGAVAAIGLVAACSGGSAGEGTGTTCDSTPDPHCAHPIDHVVVPMLRERGLPIRDASAAEVCRRMAVDLMDRLPTPEEQAACEARSLPERVDAFMATEEYVRSQRRLWANRIAYDDFVGWRGHIVELDELAARLARGEIGYAEYVGALVVHPGFLGLHYEDDWAKAVVRIAFHREARADEIAAMRPLHLGFDSVYFCDGTYYWVRSTVFGIDPEDPPGEYCDAFHPVVVGCVCGGKRCSSTVFGAAIDFEVAPCVEPSEPYDRANYFRLSAATPDGSGSTCPDGVDRPECTDRDLDEETNMTGAPFVPFPLLDEGSRGRLAALGQAMAAQNDFWHAAADRELEALLGWWKSGFRQNEWDLPAVRQVVADELRRTGSLREAQKLIMTSLLYAAPSAPPDVAGEEEPPPWSMGPVKLLAGEGWLESVAMIVGETVGRCDFRFLTTEVGTGLVNADPAQVDAVVTTLGEGFMGDDTYPLGDAIRTAEAYQRLAQSLGGCNNLATRPVTSSVGVVAAQRDIGQRLCALGRAVVPEGLDPAATADADLDVITRHLVERALGHAPDADEYWAFGTEMRACLDAGGEAGCADSHAAARWACQRIVDSAELAIY